jgi:hypothetical protein
MKFFGSFFRLIFASLLFFGLVKEGYGQVLRSTRVVNSCVTEYTFGNAAEDQFVIVVVICNTSPTGTVWQPPLGLTELTELLIVAGGGAGGKRDDNGNRGAGGGGAGGVVHVTNPNLMVFDIDDEDNPVLSPHLNIFVGDGGKGSTLNNKRGTNGENSLITTLNANFSNQTALGGGAGGSANGNGTTSMENQPYTDERRGNIGGSGGGSVWGFANGNNPILGGEGTGPQGNNGANGRGNDQVNGGGGGGANGVAPPIQGSANGGNGGPGRGINNNFYVNLLIPELPTSVPRMFAGGGAGVAGNPGGGGGVGTGGVGGGGNAVANGNGVDGIPNTGGGGGAGGASGSNSFRGGNGGSGIVIFRFDFINILPVEFAYYEARFLRQTRSSVISWATTKEWESSHFEIERAIQGVNFEKIGEVEAAGWSDAKVAYKFEDKNLPLTGGNILYRLKQVDFDGTFSYSSVMSVRVPSVEFTSGVWRAFPNPTDGNELRVSLLDAGQYSQEPLTFRLIHPTAQTRPVTVASESEMNEILSKMLLKIPKGVFVVEIQWGQKVEHIKVLRQ